YVFYFIALVDHREFCHNFSRIVFTLFLTCISGAGAAYVYKGLWSTNQHNQIFLRTISFSVSGSTIGLSTSVFDSHCV
ncbi:TPA: hypothetical protein IVA22_24705, partial [Escherichia coli]|nr:hypothetical protein [Escherichia coli]